MMGPVRHGALILLLAGVALSLPGCSEETPLGPEIDPLVGRWVGSFTSPMDGSTTSNSLTITVAAGGLATGAGHTWETVDNLTVEESLFLEIEVAPDGSLVGTGRWLFYAYVEGFTGIWNDGDVIGSLDGGTGAGSGELRMLFPDGMVVVPWTVTKVTNP